jgi:serine/threonine protein kinase
VEEVLGKGMFGTVYKAQHTETHLVVALKQIDLTSIEKTKLPGVMVRGTATKKFMGLGKR